MNYKKDSVLVKEVCVDGIWMRNEEYLELEESKKNELEAKNE